MVTSQCDTCITLKNLVKVAHQSRTGLKVKPFYHLLCTSAFCKYFRLGRLRQMGQSQVK